MPSTVTKTVKASGGDYSSLSGWEAGQQGDLTAADEIRQAECYKDFGSGGDTTVVTIDGWTTDATRYIRVYAPSGQRHNGIAGTGYLLKVSSSPDLQISEENVRVEGIEFDGNSGSDVIVRVTSSGARDVRISHCILHHSNTANSGLQLDSGGSGTVKVWNCLFHNCPKFGVACNLDLYLYDCTFVDCASQGSIYAVAQFAGTFVVKNTIVQNPNVARGGGSVDFGGSFTSSDYNLSGDATAPGAHSRLSKTVTFVSSTDFHLASSDAEAKDNGTDLSADANIAVSDDIDFATRSGSWDMGADELAAVPVPTYSKFATTARYPMAQALFGGQGRCQISGQRLDRQAFFDTCNKPGEGLSASVVARIWLWGGLSAPFLPTTDWVQDMMLAGV